MPSCATPSYTTSNKNILLQFDSMSIHTMPVSWRINLWGIAFNIRFWVSILIRVGIIGRPVTPAIFRVARWGPRRWTSWSLLDAQILLLTFLEMWRLSPLCNNAVEFSVLMATLGDGDKSICHLLCIPMELSKDSNSCCNRVVVTAKIRGWRV